jgi:hypothetical protein
VQFCSLKVLIDATDKDSKTYTANIRKYGMGTPEDLLKWRTTLNEQIKNNGFAGNYKMVVNLAQAMLGGRSLDAFVKEGRSQEVKNKTRLTKGTTGLTAQQIYDYAIFELAIRAFYTQSGWKDAFERQREYTRRYIFMGKLNPEKFSQRLHEMNRYLDFIPMEKNTAKDTKKSIVWRWTWNVKYQTCKVTIDLWCKAIPCKTIPCTTVLGSDYKK